jgi:hypothetical protein
MKQHEVPRQEWGSFLGTFSDAHRAWLATLEGADARAEERPLDSVESSGGAIVIHFHDAADVRIDAPLSVCVAQTDRGEDLGLDIESSRGVTRLRFRAAALPEALDGIGPAGR